MSNLTKQDREELDRAHFLTPPTLEDDPVHQAVERILERHAEQIREETLTTLKALADEWERIAVRPGGAYEVCARELRAVIAAKVKGGAR